MPRFNHNLTEYRNFRGLFTKSEAGLIPSNPETGVYASELLNVNTEDGTITWDKGYAIENDGSTEVTFGRTTTGSYVRQSFAFKRMDGKQMKVLWTNDGYLLWWNSVLNKYEVFGTPTQLPSEDGKDIGWTVYMRASTDYYQRNKAFFGTGGTGINTWSAGVTTFASATATTVTKQGTTSFQVEGFTATGSFYMNNILYTYTGGYGTTTLTGVTPDPTAGGAVVGQGIAQVPLNNEISAVASIFANIHFVYQGRLGLASNVGTQIWLSKVGDPYDFTTTGTGGFITINIGEGNGPFTGIAVYKDQIIAMKQDAILSINITLTSATSEVTRIKPHLLRPNCGVIKQDLMAIGQDELFFVSYDKKVQKITNLTQLSSDSSPNIEPISTNVDPSLMGMTFTNGRAYYKDEKFVFSCSTDGVTVDTLIEYDNHKKDFYFRGICTSCFFIVGNNLFFCNPFYLSSFLLDDSYDFDTGEIGYLWKSPRHNLGEEFKKKATKMFAIHMRMSTNSIVNAQIDYNSLGTLYSLNFDVAGDGSSSSDGLYVIGAPLNTSYGTNAYGLVPYGSNTTLDTSEDMVEIIVFKSLPLRYSPYDYTITFSGQGNGQRAKILSYGFMSETRAEIPKKALVQ